MQAKAVILAGSQEAADKDVLVALNDRINAGVGDASLHKTFNLAGLMRARKG